MNEADNNIFKNLFVLELANNHRGSVERGLKIINDFSEVIKANKVRAAIKLQLRDVETFIHKDFTDRKDIKYIKKVLDTKMSENDYQILVDAIKTSGCIAMATPFDEKSVDLCMDLGIQVLKIASSCINDRMLVEKITSAQKPVIISTGGAYTEDIDDTVLLFTSKNIPFALNHCVSIYPSKCCELELNQIDFLKNRYPDIVIGFSTHEYNDTLEESMMIAYAKGARTFERHIDIEFKGQEILDYCSLPEDINRWIKAFYKAEKLCGKSADKRRDFSKKEMRCLESFARGMYARNDLPENHVISEKDIYFAIPLQKGQASCKELITGKILSKPCKKDAPILKNLLLALICLFMLLVSCEKTFAEIPLNATVSEYYDKDGNKYVYVKGYTKKDGTVVKGYYRSVPNKDKSDNLSSKGNINPFTGKKGQKKY